MAYYYFGGDTLEDSMRFNSTDTEIYANSINITGVDVVKHNSKEYVLLSFEFLVVFKDASRWVRDIMWIKDGDVQDVFMRGVRWSLADYVEKQRRILSSRSAKLVPSTETDYNGD